MATPLLLVLLWFVFNTQAQNKVLIDFDDAEAWSGGAMGTYNAKTYSAEEWLFSANDAIRESTTARVTGVYSWRIRNSVWVAENTSTTTYAGFEIKVRPWSTTEPNPSNPFSLSLSVDGGENWTIVQDQITGVNPLVWLTYGYSFAEKEFAEGELLIKLEALGTDHRLNVGSFHVFVPYGDEPGLFTSVSELSGLFYQEGQGPSDFMSFGLNGANLNGSDVVIHAPANFEVSANKTGPYKPELVLDSYCGTSTAVYVRMVNGLAPGDYQGTIDIAGGDAGQIGVDVSGTVIQAFRLPYVNALRTDEERELAVMHGFDLSSVHPANGYTRISSDTYIETPPIDVSAVHFLKTSFSTATFGGFGNQELQLQLSVDGEPYEDIFSVFPTTADPYLDSEWLIDLTDKHDKAQVQLRFEMVSGSYSIRFRDLSIAGYEQPAIAKPVFDLPEGTYFENQTVYVSNYSDYPETVTVHYTVDGTTPDHTGNLYDHLAGIVLEDGHGSITLKAVAISADEKSMIQTANYLFPVNVESIGKLRQQTTGTTIYRVCSEPTYIGGTTCQSTMFFQDGSGFGIQLDDPAPAVITTTYNTGDKVKTLTGRLVVNQGQLMLNPVLDPGTPVSSGHVVSPVVRTLNELNHDDQSRLVKILQVEFEDGDGVSTFEGEGYVTNITDPDMGGYHPMYKNIFWCSDITGSALPDQPVDMLAIMQQYDGGYYVSARSLADFKETDTDRPAVPEILTFDDEVVVLSGEFACFHAQQSIWAGGDHGFQVEPGGHAELRAGEQIVLLPGVTIKPGGYLHALITDQFCDEDTPPTPSEKAADKEKPTATASPHAHPQTNVVLNLFPNPTPGPFTLEVVCSGEEPGFLLDIFNVLGYRVLSDKLAVEKLHSLNLADQPPGIYVVRVVIGNQAAVKRLIRK